MKKDLKPNYREFEQILGNKKYIGAVCREVRENAGYSVSKFAELWAHTSRQNIYNFESGKTTSLSLFMEYIFLEKYMRMINNEDN